MKKMSDASFERKASGSTAECASVKKGDQLPHGVLHYVDDHDQVQAVTTEHVFKGKRSILLGLGDISTPPEFEHFVNCVASWSELSSRGSQQLVATAIDDAFVLKGFRKTHNAPDHVWAKADSKGEFAKALGLFDASTGHSKHYAMIVDEGMTIRWLMSGDMSNAVEELLDNLNIFGQADRAPSAAAGGQLQKESKKGKGKEKDWKASSAQPHLSRAEKQDHDKLELTESLQQQQSQAQDDKADGGDAIQPEPIADSGFRSGSGSHWHVVEPQPQGGRSSISKKIDLAALQKLEAAAPDHSAPAHGKAKSMA